MRRRAADRADQVLRAVFWDTGIARLLPRLLKGRTRGAGQGLLSTRRTGRNPAVRLVKGVWNGTGVAAAGVRSGAVGGSASRNSLHSPTGRCTPDSTHPVRTTVVSTLRVDSTPARPHPVRARDPRWSPPCPLIRGSTVRHGFGLPRGSAVSAPGGVG